jgi:short-subunit dehydrogenase/acyl carrier protein
VLSLLALQQGPHSVFSAVSAGVAGTVALVQALGDAGVDAPLWVATCGAVSVGVGDVLADPVQAQAWGLGRVVGLEHPQRWGGLVDLPGVLDDRGQVWLGEVLAGVGTEDQVAVRASGVFGRRLVRAGGQGSSVRRWKPRGTVLIVGGTGGLGAHTARWLAHSGVDHLVLVSRRGRRAAGTEQLQAELSELGVGVSVVACDASDKQALAAVLAKVPAQFPLSAVVHAAAVLDDGVLDDLTIEQLEPAVRAKVQTAWNLHELTQDLDLSAFVLFSSFSGVVGIPSQGNYAPWNAFLDALAQHRRQLGLAATSIAWGAWAGTGLSEALAGMLDRHGIPAMDPQLALNALQQVLDRDEDCVAVADVAWERFLARFTAARPSALLGELAPARPAASAADDGQVLARRLGALTQIEAVRVLTDLVQTQAAAVLGHDSAQAVPAERSFQGLGFDSLAAVELRNRLNTATGLRLPATAVFDYPSPAALAGYLHTQLHTRHEPQAITAMRDLERALATATDSDTHATVMARLQALVTNWKDTTGTPLNTTTSHDLKNATDEEMYELLSKNFGIS